MGAFGTDGAWRQATLISRIPPRDSSVEEADMGGLSTFGGLPERGFGLLIE